MKIAQLTNIISLNGHPNEWIMFVETSKGALEMKISTIQAKKLTKYMKNPVKNTSNPFFTEIVYLSF